MPDAQATAESVNGPAGAGAAEIARPRTPARSHASTHSSPHPGAAAGEIPSARPAATPTAHEPAWSSAYQSAISSSGDGIMPPAARNATASSGSLVRRQSSLARSGAPTLGPARAGTMWRAPAEGPSAPSAAPGPDASAASDQALPAGGPEIGELAERIYEMLVRRLAIERERRGLAR
jgi:hypothetical protein